MQVRFFAIPIHGGEEAAETLNRFLAGHRIVAMDRAFVQDGANSLWAVSVTVVQAASRPQAPRKATVDYKEVLSDGDFALFAKLRSLRKDLAEAGGVPAYALFTNDQLAEMAQRRVASAAALREIAGVGEARARKYGAPFLDIIRAGSIPPRPKGGDGHAA